MRKALCAFLFLVALAYFCRAHTAIEIGGDEGMELQKARLLATQPDKVSQMWNDQPLLYTVLSAKLFKAFGMSPAIPRLLTLIAVFVCLLQLPQLITVEVSSIRWLATALLLLTWPNILNLVPVGMCEVPAFCTACAACALILTGLKSSDRYKLWGGAILLAVGIHWKLTALIVLPALALAVATVNCEKKQVILGSSVFVCATIVLWMILPPMSFDMLLGSHAQAGEALRQSASQFGKWEPRWLADNPAHLLLAGYGLFQIWRRNPRDAAFPLTLLITALAIHSFHRPWWWYYSIHFAVPFALLDGIGVEGLLRALTEPGAPQPEERDSRIFQNARFRAILGCTLTISLWLGFNVPQTFKQVAAVRRGSTHDSELVARLRELQPRTKWAYSPRGLAYLFAANMNVPPELVILSDKRFLSGHLTDEHLISIILRYRPDVLLLSLPPEQGPTSWPTFVTDNYTLTYQDAAFYLYEKSAPSAVANVTTAGTLRRMGL